MMNTLREGCITFREWAAGKRKVIAFSSSGSLLKAEHHQDCALEKKVLLTEEATRNILGVLFTQSV